MIQLQGAGKRFGHKLLFEDCDWLITPKERTGLVGANGTGKSTLLKILCGMETLDYGEVTFAKGITQGYLPQDGLSLSGRTVFAECMSVFQDLREMEQEMESLHAQAGRARSSRAGVRRRVRPLPSHRFRIPQSRRLRHRSAGGHGAHRPRLPQRRLAPPHRGVLRRLADAHRAGQAAARKAEPAAARRAHQSPRPRSAQLAGIVPGRLIPTPTC